MQKKQCSIIFTYQLDNCFSDKTHNWLFLINTYTLVHSRIVFYVNPRQQFEKKIYI